MALLWANVGKYPDIDLILDPVLFWLASKRALLFTPR